MSLPERTQDQQTALAGTGATAIVAASGDVLVFRDLVGLTITTPNAAAGTLTISDGTKNHFVIDYPNAAAAPSVPLILEFSDVPVPQSVANLAWTITPSVNASGYKVTAQFRERQ